MNAIPSSSPAPVAPLPAMTRATDSTGAAGGDMLAAMRPAMDTAFQVGRPVDARGAAAVLGTGGSYVQGASATLVKLDEGIARRRQEIAELRLSDPDAAKDRQGQLEMLERLRDRIQLSIERVSDILAGKDRDDIGGPEPDITKGRRDARSRRERDAQDLELLEQRRQLLAPKGADAVGSADTALVVGTYASSGTSNATHPH